MSDHKTVDLLIEAIDEESGGPLTSEGVELVRRGWIAGQSLSDNKITALRQQLEQAEVRLAWFEDWRERFRDSCNGNPDAWLLRKQADALLDASNAMSDGFNLPSDNYAEEVAVIRCQQFVCDLAQKLYAKAGEQEKGND